MVQNPTPSSSWDGCLGRFQSRKNLLALCWKVPKNISNDFGLAGHRTKTFPGPLRFRRGRGAPPSGRPIHPWQHPPSPSQPCRRRASSSRNSRCSHSASCRPPPSLGSRTAPSRPWNVAGPTLLPPALQGGNTNMFFCFFCFLCVFFFKFCWYFSDFENYIFLGRFSPGLFAQFF